jgi:hypothetical protein
VQDYAALATSHVETEASSPTAKSTTPEAQKMLKNLKSNPPLIPHHKQYKKKKLCLPPQKYFPKHFEEFQE